MPLLNITYHLVWILSCRQVETTQLGLVDSSNLSSDYL